MNIQKIVKIVALVIGLIAVFFLVNIMRLDEAIEADVANQAVLANFATLAYCSWYRNDFSRCIQFD